MIEITTTVQCNDNDRNYSEKDDSWKCATSVALVGTAGCTFPCKIIIKKRFQSFKKMAANLS